MTNKPSCPSCGSTLVIPFPPMGKMHKKQPCLVCPNIKCSVGCECGYV